MIKPLKAPFRRALLIASAWALAQTGTAQDLDDFELSDEISAEIAQEQALEATRKVDCQAQLLEHEKTGLMAQLLPYCHRIESGQEHRWAVFSAQLMAKGPRHVELMFTNSEGVNSGLYRVNLDNNHRFQKGEQTLNWRSLANGDQIDWYVKLTNKSADQDSTERSSDYFPPL